MAGTMISMTVRITAEGGSSVKVQRPANASMKWNNKLTTVPRPVFLTSHRCVASSNGPQSPYTSIDRLLGLLEAEAIEKKADIMSQQMVSKIKPVAEAAFSFAGCVKQCFMKKNSRGYCFDRVGCQPRITPENLLTSLKKCSRGLNWKKEAGSLCACAQAAGVVGLQEVCPLLKMMG